MAHMKKLRKLTRYQEITPDPDCDPGGRRGRGPGTAPQRRSRGGVEVSRRAFHFSTSAGRVSQAPLAFPANTKVDISGVFTPARLRAKRFRA